MRFKYSTNSPTQNEFDSLARIPLILEKGDNTVQATGLLDSGATVSVLPLSLGIKLGGIWDESKATIQLAGNLGDRPAIPFITTAKIADFEPTRLVFAWISSSNFPLILGQTNFFLEFDVCFYRSKLEFEIKPSS